MDGSEGLGVDRWDAGARAHSGAFDAAFRPGSTEDALRDGPRQFFELAAQVARGQFDPVTQWDDFVQALWEQVDVGFGISPGAEDGYPGVPRAWFDDPDDPDVLAWEGRPESS